ncbi:hypothetical protein DsansV1_C04g0047001 [Dioscorea sansibarensis]
MSSIYVVKLTPEMVVPFGQKKHVEDARATVPLDRRSMWRMRELLLRHKN